MPCECAACRLTADLKPCPASISYADRAQRLCSQHTYLDERLRGGAGGLGARHGYGLAVAHQVPQAVAGEDEAAALGGHHDLERGGGEMGKGTRVCMCVCMRACMYSCV